MISAVHHLIRSLGPTAWPLSVAIALVAAVTVRPADAMTGLTMMPAMSADPSSFATDGTIVPFAPVSLPRGGVRVNVNTTAALADLFARHNYGLTGVRRAGTVPRLFVAVMPPDLKSVASARERKAMFIRITLPLVLAANESIIRDRIRIEALRDRLVGGQPLSIEPERWLAGMFVRYDVPMFDFAELLRRVDVVAPSLAIAQSAVESGWGTSRFARKGNALFGQRIFKGTNGLIPLARNPGARHRVRAFSRLLDGVRAYAANLNSHPAYRQFRAARAALRRIGRPLDGLALVHTLRLYSERRDAYVATIRRIIHIDGLTVFDGVRLGGSISEIAFGPNI